MGDKSLSARVLAGVVCVLLVLAACADPPSDDDGGEDSGDGSTILRSSWGELFAEAGVEGTFVLRELGSDATLVWNSERAAEPRRPASTFKILNSLIILETGVLADADTTITWDGVDRDGAGWNQDHTLRSAIELSVVWVYQALAREVGPTRMADWVARSGYGNADIGGGIDMFWLTGDLRISPLGQADFLERLVRRDLPFRPEVMDAVDDILVRAAGDGWTWSHKTGTAISDGSGLGWLVGTTSYDGRSWVFAMNIDPPSGGSADPLLRQQISRRILEMEGALPP